MSPTGLARRAPCARQRAEPSMSRSTCDRRSSDHRAGGAARVSGKVTRYFVAGAGPQVQLFVSIKVRRTLSSTRSLGWTGPAFPRANLALSPDPGRQPIMGPTKEAPCRDPPPSRTDASLVPQAGAATIDRIQTAGHISQRPVTCCTHCGTGTPVVSSTCVMWFLPASTWTEAVKASALSGLSTLSR
jgi:hypothetical protein